MPTVTLKTLQGLVVTFGNVNLSDTLSDLMQLREWPFSPLLYPPENQIVLFNAKRIGRHLSLAGCGVSHGSTLRTLVANSEAETDLSPARAKLLERAIDERCDAGDASKRDARSRMDEKRRREKEQHEVTRQQTRRENALYHAREAATAYAESEDEQRKCIREQLVSHGYIECSCNAKTILHQRDYLIRRFLQKLALEGGDEAQFLAELSLDVNVSRGKKSDHATFLIPDEPLVPTAGALSEKAARSLRAERDGAMSQLSELRSQVKVLLNDARRFKLQKREAELALDTSLAEQATMAKEADRREQEEHERHLRLVQRVVAEELQDAASVASQSDSDVSETDAETEVVYEITVVTSTERGAGTDANVWVEIEGDSGSTGEVLLHSAGIKDPFERGQRDVFHVQWAELGQLCAVSVGHDCSGMGSSWLLDHIVVRNLGPNAERAEGAPVWKFECGQWLQKVGGDTEPFRRLMAARPRSKQHRKSRDAATKSKTSKSKTLDASSSSTLPKVRGATPTQRHLHPSYANKLTASGVLEISDDDGDGASFTKPRKSKLSASGMLNISDSSDEDIDSSRYTIPRSKLTASGKLNISDDSSEED